MNEDITPTNCRLLLAAFIEKETLTAPSVAKAIGCRHATLARILSGKSIPTDALMKQVGIMIGIGFSKYETLSEAEKEKIAEAIGAVGGGVLGFGSIAAAVSASGAVAGLSAAGITSGLAAIGTIVGGGMMAGVAVAAAIPLAAGAIGYAVIKGVKYFFSETEFNKDELDPRWEIETRG